MPDAAYHRAYRAANKERINAQLRERRRARPRVRGDRSAEYARRRSRAAAVPEIPPAYSGHRVFDRARKIVGPAPYLDREAWEDDMGTVVVALLERRGPSGARDALVAQRSARVARGINEHVLEDDDGRRDAEGTDEGAARGGAGAHRARAAVVRDLRV